MSFTLVLIGLPGVGKTTISNELGSRLGMEVISTDPLFRIYRSIPLLDDKREGHEIMNRFIKKKAGAFYSAYEARNFDEMRKIFNFGNRKPKVARSFDELLEMAETGALSNSNEKTGFRSFGEDVFRLFEHEMLRWLVKAGKFAEKIPDLSASAMLYPANRKLFSEENGFKVILLKREKQSLVENLYRDYIEAQETGKVKRGAYEGVVKAALEEGVIAGSEEAIKNKLAEKSQADYDFRWETYVQLAGEKNIVNVTDREPSEIAAEIESRLSEIAAEIDSQLLEKKTKLRV